MTDSKKGNGIVLARVMNKTTGTYNQKGWVYRLSSGHKIRFMDDCLDLGEWYFFEMKVNSLTQKASFVSCEKVDKAYAEKMGTCLKDLELAAGRAATSWRSLGANERAVVMKSLGMVGAGVGSASFLGAGAYGVAEAIAAESILGVCTGGLSLIAGGVLAGMSYLQYEELKASLSQHTEALARYRMYRDILAKHMIKVVPSKYFHHELLDPEFEGICQHMSALVRNFNWRQLFDVTDSQYEYAVA